LDTLSTPEHTEDDRLIRPHEAKTLFGVSTRTLRRWHDRGLISARRTMGGQRRYWEGEVRKRAAELDEAAA
jgi:DNA-binding transcriptional MerR regulator